jgi:hypothetical protein
LLGVAVFLVGCSKHLLTGEPLIYGVVKNSGQIVDRDVDTGGVSIHKGEIITLIVNNVFIRFLEGFDSPHVLVYVEVYDDGTDNPETAFRKVLFNSENTPQGVHLGLSDRIIYGPTSFKGYPIRVKFFIVKLNKSKKELASKLINAAGSLAQMVQPQYAIAVGVSLQLAQALNELTEDDFELRFDLTLYPLGANKEKWSVNDAELTKVNKIETVQRHGKNVFLATPLRTGSYIILKRELAERFQKQKTSVSEFSDESILIMDHTQEAFIKRYISFKDSEEILTEEILRYMGGYLYWIVVDPNKTHPQKQQSQVRTSENPTVPTILKRGLRTLFYGRTYTVITVITGLTEGLAPEAMKASADKELEQVRNLLINPNQLPVRERLSPYIDLAANNLKGSVEYRQLNILAARAASRDPNFRKSPGYPAYWVSSLEEIESLPANEIQRAKAKNAFILSTLSEVVVNLPPDSRTNDADAVACIRQFNENDFEAYMIGLFKLKDQSLKNFKDCLQAKKKPQPSKEETSSVNK